MKKTKNKLWVTLFVILMLISTTCFAASVSSTDATLTLVENNVCTIQVTDFVQFEKSLLAFDKTNKEFTIQLAIANTAEEVFPEPTEIFLVIDNSLSMDDEISPNVTRLAAVTNSAKTLASQLLENENVDLGVISFSTGDEEGTITDANLLLAPSHDVEAVTDSIDSIASGELGPRTNIDAGLTLANQNFSEDCQSKYIVLLTDGVPNTAVGGPTQTYSGQTATKTKATLQNINAQGVHIFSLMTGVVDVEEPSTNISYKTLAEEIFGTPEEPTVGKFYYITDNEIEQTVSETILADITNVADSTIHDLDIYDYFPQEIIDNFDFGYVTSPNLGTVSAEINLEDRYIVWHIDALAPGQNGFLAYKFSLKSTINSEIDGQTLPTNEKVEITSEDITTEDGSHTVSSTVSPQVQVNLPEETPAPTPTNTVDNTVANTVIPQTGTSNFPIVFIGMVAIVAIIIGVRFYQLRKNVK